MNKVLTSGVVLLSASALMSCQLTDNRDHSDEPNQVDMPATPTADVVYSETFDSYNLGQRWQSLTDTEIIKDCGGDRAQCLQVTYKPTNRGSARIETKIAIEGGEHYSLLYDIKFVDGFEFVRGGKLPGLSPTVHTTGCQPAIANAWSVRTMWRANGSAQAYHYGQNRVERCGDGERSPEGAFVVGQWQRIELEVKLNSAPNAGDGFVDLKVDGKSVSKAEQMNLRGVMTDDTLINQFFFSTFYGGAKPDWAPSKTTYILFDNFQVVNHGGR